MEVENKAMDKTGIVDQALSNINVDYVREAIKISVRNQCNTVHAKNTKRHIMLAVAAVVLLLLVGGVLAVTRFGNAKPHNFATSFAEFIILAKNVSEERGTKMTVTNVQVGSYVAQYSLIYMSLTEMETDGDSADQASMDAVYIETLKEFVGDLYSKVPLQVGVTIPEISEDEYRLAQSCSWYKIKGFSDLQYLIREDLDGNLSIWKYNAFLTKGSEELNVMFSNCKFEPYTYGEVLEAIYQVKNADDIICFQINPSDSDNTPEGKALKESIKPLTIEDRESIMLFFEMIHGMECYGPNSISLQHYEIRSSVIGEALNTDNHARTSYLRDLVLTLSDGRKIDNLKYSAIWGAFYENNSIAFQKLNNEDMIVVNELFAIHTE